MLHIFFGCMHIGAWGLVLIVFPFVFLNILFVFAELRGKDLLKNHSIQFDLSIKEHQEDERNINHQ